MSIIYAPLCICLLVTIAYFALRSRWNSDVLKCQACQKGQNDLLGVLKLPILTEFDRFGPKFRFSLDLFGSNFQRPAVHPHQFSDRPPPPPRGVVHPCRVGDIRWPCQKRRAVGQKRQHVINRRLRVLPTCLEWLRLSRRARDAAATMLHHSKHRGESATKTIKFFVAHTVNYTICNNHTKIDWVLLNFTPVIQQNYHQPGRMFEKLFCAVDRLSCQLELSKSETSQFRSDLVFDIVNYVHLIFFHGGLNVVFGYLTSSFCVA